ncbi:acyl-CoA dehydrogenase [Paenibacillus sp. N1-5-1-14]|uniref:acyl-CoA dehydrogenase n=1 Tax=Paenibacillus radicibacter TaxID=2972488 RepID=UPI0021595EA9|nr:acyl-CoA dehydrogenase [Paenibacillus radicibacter]MCR8642048.1 acyl-CoA dehydrogenase [Paenibacillus radicibacter]
MNFQLTEEQVMLCTMIRDFAKSEVEPTAIERDENESWDMEIWRKMASLGLTGIPWPEQYGGAGADYLSYVLAVEELSKIDASVGVTLSAHVSLASWPVYSYGTEEQKLKFLKPMAEGKRMGAYCLTEPGSGSDSSNMKTTAILQDEEWLLNGTKIFITNGSYADVFIVFAQTDPAMQHKGITAFIVEKDTPGLTIGKKEKKMGIRSSSTTQVIFEDCKVPKANMLGQVGEGFKIAMKTLDGGRSGIAAQAVGIAQGAFDLAIQYALTRVQFGKPIAKMQAIQFKLADMATKIEAARLLTYQAAWREDQGLSYGCESSMAKLFASDAAMEVTTEAVQIFGGYGYIREYAVERFMRDAKITQIYEGTNEIQRLVISSHLMKEAEGRSS